MWHDMFVDQISSGEKILRTVLVYALVAVLIRLSGKRGLAGLNTLDIVVMTLLSNVVQNAIIGNDLSVTGGAIGAATLVAVNAIANRVAVRSEVFSRLFDGTDTQVITDGRVQTKALQRLGMSTKTLDHAVRMQNGEDVSQVADGVLEPGGQLLLTLRPQEQGATKADVGRLAEQLARIERALDGLATTRTS
ncbi:DUF421 domain-containing protein [uncultured Jatrophihabitans sp.]|uniref:DUF421 domain-containing protein n=1 Tax=uncultured Jatrophihabitans sp. TaxID=1610747 RepID=UPI0035CC99B2